MLKTIKSNKKLWLILVFCFFYSILTCAQKPRVKEDRDSIKISRLELNTVNGVIASLEVERLKNKKLLELVKSDSVSIVKRDSVIARYTDLSGYQKKVVEELKKQVVLEKRKRTKVTYILCGIILGLTGYAIAK